jgi:hypothetical protein
LGLVEITEDEAKKLEKKSKKHDCDGPGKPLLFPGNTY